MFITQGSCVLRAIVAGRLIGVCFITWSNCLNGKERSAASEWHSYCNFCDVNEPDQA